MSEIDDRRQRAREAMYDAMIPLESNVPAAGLEAAIEVATQVKITGDICGAAMRAYDAHGAIFRMQDVIEAAFRAAGFEVVE